MRLPRSLMLAAKRESPNLLLLLPELRELSSARSELRWITDHVHEKAADAVGRGVRGVPLQYLLGNQPFGESLDILCRPGVLIPRWETEEWGMALSQAIKRHHPFFVKPSVSGSNSVSDSNSSVADDVIKVLDLCTGTGCLALLLAQQLQPPAKHSVQITGVDISPTAVALAKRNRLRNFGQIDHNVSVTFLQDDVFTFHTPDEYFDLVIANPPYISEEHYNSSYHVLQSVRRHEPKLALVGGVEFYDRIIAIANAAHAKAVACEIADEDQLREIQSTCFSDTSDVWNTGAMRDSAGVIRTFLAWRNDCNKDWGWMSQLLDIS
ncbi:S-adenosyl-L-methionine-dependent methyltransferase [Lipomyces arxii]|uniref:S-adenosyl-L-methionine-dependent methyltransferase n=1 Tax=Lipomyces arxii TaxID=56418 RepID=UPI0034CDC59D